MNLRLAPVNLLARFLLASLLVFAGLLPAIAQQGDPDQIDEGTSSERKPGITVIVEATGSVQIIEAPGQPARPVQKGERLPEGGFLITGSDGRVDLAFSNGAFMQIQENSRFGVGEFQQEAYEFVFSNSQAVSKRDLEESVADESLIAALDASEGTWNKMEQEPTTSVTRFELEYGTIIGESKRLRPGSRMDIVTPIGVAGIRGTTWRLTLHRAVDVAGGFTMRVDAQLTEGLVRINSIESGRMSPERAAVLQQVIQAIQTVQTSFQAVQGTLGVLVNVLSAMSGVDANNSQAVSDAALSVAGSNPEQVGQVAQIVSAMVILGASPENAPRVISDMVGALVSRNPQSAPNIVSGVIASASIAANNGFNFSGERTIHSQIFRLGCD
jgi:hypothetical protein